MHLFSVQSFVVGLQSVSELQLVNASGETVGILEGTSLGSSVGRRDGLLEGPSVGDVVGIVEGSPLGSLVGRNDGLFEGLSVGGVVGILEGSSVGRWVGRSEGSSVGGGVELIFRYCSEKAPLEGLMPSQSAASTEAYVLRMTSVPPQLSSPVPGCTTVPAFNAIKSAPASTDGPCLSGCNK